MSVKLMPHAKNERGMALVLVLSVLVLITALVVEFSYGIFMNTEYLGNWQTSNKLSLTVNSGTSLAAMLVSEASKSKKYTYPGSVTLPPTVPFNSTDESTGLLSVSIQDENAKFNLNTLVLPNGKLNEEAYASFVRMLETLNIKTGTADLIADWIDPDSLPRISGGEAEAKNAALDSTEEVLAIVGIDQTVYDKLYTYITIYGGGTININSATEPVLMSLSEEIDSELAQRVIAYRQMKPFTKTGELTKVAGFENLGISLMGKITVKSKAFWVESIAGTKDGIKRVITCVLDPSGKIKYWKEF